MKLVRDRLFIGNITDANSVIQSTDPTITHMLSLLSSQVLYQQNPKPGDPYALVTMRPGPHYLPLPTVTSPSPTVVSAPSRAGDGAGDGGAAVDEEAEKKRGDPVVQQPDKSQEDDPRGAELVRMTVPLRDMESENLLDHLEACLNFIEEGMKVGNVLVHCLAGVSRSASVITAYLMRTENLSLDDALDSLREASSMVCPNDGFMDQLKMFEDMGFKVDRSSPTYKHFHLTNLGEAYEKGEKIESSRFATDPGADNTPLAESIGSKLKLEDREEENREPTLYRCKKCRRLVACEKNVMPHSSPPSHESFFKSKRRGGGRDGDNDYGEPKCTSIFVEPMQWMTAVTEGNVEGKLNCVKCQARLGNFHWAGLQCSCGAWVNPAFQMHKSRMDLTWI